MRDGFWGLKRMGCGEGLIALLQRTGQPLNRKWAVCVCIEGAEWGMGRRPECTDFPCTIWGPRASCWTCLGHSLPICKTRAWSRPFCFKESISGLSELPRPRHIPVGEVCQAGEEDGWMGLSTGNSRERNAVSRQKGETVCFWLSSYPRDRGKRRDLIGEVGTQAGQ